MKDDAVTVTTIPSGPPRWKQSATGPSYVSDGSVFARLLGYVIENPNGEWGAVAITPGTLERPAHTAGHLGNFPAEAEARAAVEASVRSRASPD